MAATAGWPSTMAPSSVWKNPDWSGSVSGTPSYLMTTLNRLPVGIPASGVTVNSPASRLHPAATPSTIADRTVSPSRSRLKLDRFWVAVAEIVATPASTSVAGS